MYPICRKVGDIFKGNRDYLGCREHVRRMHPDFLSGDAKMGVEKISST